MSKNNEKMVASNFNLKTLNSSEYKDAIKASLDSEGSLAIFGRRGSGKTMIAKSTIKEMDFFDATDPKSKPKKCKEVYWNLSTMERVDVGGYPDLIGSKSDYISFKLPETYRDMIEGDTPVVALLDEVDKADPSLWAPLLEFVQFHTINGRPLKNLKSVIMTGNLISEGGSKPCLPLLDRVAKFLLEPDVPSWMEWAGASQKIHPSVVSYIYDNQTDLFGQVDPDESYADPSPRAWENASKFLFAGERQNWSEDKMYRMVIGCVGNAVGTKYKTYFDHYHKILPMIKKVFDGKEFKEDFGKLSTVEKLVASMIAASRVTVSIDSPSNSSGKISKETSEALKHFSKMIMMVSEEYRYIAIRSQIQLERIIRLGLDEHPEFGAVTDSIKKKIGAGRK